MDLLVVTDEMRAPLTYLAILEHFLSQEGKSWEEEEIERILATLPFLEDIFDTILTNLTSSDMDLIISSVSYFFSKKLR